MQDRIKIIMNQKNGKIKKKTFIDGYDPFESAGPRTLTYDFYGIEYNAY